MSSLSHSEHGVEITLCQHHFTTWTEECRGQEQRKGNREGIKEHRGHRREDRVVCRGRILAAGIEEKRTGEQRTEGKAQRTEDVGERTEDR